MYYKACGGTKIDNTLIGIILVVLDTFVFALATLLLKKYMISSQNNILQSYSFFKKIIIFIFNIKFIFINLLLLTSMLLLISSYHFADLSLILPLGSLTQVFSVFFGYLFLNEKIHLSKGIGLFLIIVGSIAITLV